MIGILEPLNFSSKAIEDLGSIGHVDIYDDGSIEAFLSNKEILFVRLGYQITREILEKAPNLKYLCSPTTGLNHIDQDAAREYDVTVVSLKGEVDFLNNIRATPEHIFGLTIALLRNYKKAFSKLAIETWNRDLYRGAELYGKNIGIIGLGRIGRRLNEFFKPFGATIHWYDKNTQSKIDAQGAVKHTDIESLIKSVEIVIISIDFNKENEDLFDKDKINMMENKWVINCSRGEVFDEAYLLKMASKGWFKGLALDVICNETAPKNNRMEWVAVTEDQNVIVTPHIGGCTYESMEKTELFIVNKLIREMH